ncbi:MAG: bacteriohemerythrin [Anaeromusa sp.]|uniref:bacteriohemerythrin n=1 Tax=Anaeromusa sp. TaxID=1872520 RepID=UPI002B217001|nr:bacteriohemerythrin [Anaeromusa sp.]MEA4834072.1 bacteriohemerythrin [Anaeromusa sp.]
MLQWKEEYEVGVVEIDEQHQKLIDIANRVYELMRNELALDKYDQIVEILQELKEYTVYHFHFEEGLMQKARYKKRFSHKILHQEFLAQVEAVDLSAVDENQDAYLIQIMDFIANWLIDHIVGEDKKVGKSVRAQ